MQWMTYDAKLEEPKNLKYLSGVNKRRSFIENHNTRVQEVDSEQVFLFFFFYKL